MGEHLVVKLTREGYLAHVKYLLMFDRVQVSRSCVGFDTR